MSSFNDSFLNLSQCFLFSKTVGVILETGSFGERFAMIFIKAILHLQIFRRYFESAVIVKKERGAILAWVTEL